MVDESWCVILRSRLALNHIDSRLPYATLSDELYRLGLDPVTMLMETGNMRLIKVPAPNWDQETPNRPLR